ncbi:MAG: DUF4239 domain-containing protein [Solidesulfovibrio sp.]|uniref:bestrophin-like domain n=1 Tax=Solidesulfovibrio sp. TaxID=2910990 RepID=UPI002B1F2AF9|nr:DUF4239 domain-containing protein [Solidesulfovibrio sp.]MEA4857200.1 DUF4239 domain-containing protein [Solidesulfovibrio sp.]
MDNLFWYSETTVMALLGLPTLAYLVYAYRRNAPPIQNLSETIANYGLFNSLYSIFLSMALVTLLVNFNTVQDDTRKESEAIVSTARLLNGLADAAAMKQALVAYAQSVVTYDLPALQQGRMSPQASEAFDALWNEAYRIRQASKNEEAVHHLVLGELSDMTKSRLTRRIKAKENLHPMILALIVLGYYVMLIKTWLTRLPDRKTQLTFELPMFVIIILVVTVIMDLNTPFVGIVNIDTSAFDYALQRATTLAAAPRP